MTERWPTRRSLLAAGLATAAAALPARAHAAAAVVPSSRTKAVRTPLPSGPIYDVTKFGAKTDGKTLATAAIQAAIDECGRRGGGTVILPPGEYVSAPLFLRDNVGLHLFAGARLTATADKELYPPIDGRAGGVERQVYASLITGVGVSNVAISGRGTLDGNGLVWMQAHVANAALRAKLGLIPRGEGMATHPPGSPLRYPRPRLINLVRCQGVSISEIALERTPAWTIHLVYCTDIDITGVRINGYDKGQGTSGIVLDSCKDARLSSCHLSAGDDGIALKAGYDEDGRRVGIDCSDVVIQNCTFLDSAGAGIALGSETAAGIRNVTVTNCVFDNVAWAFRIKSNRGRGGGIESVRLSGLIIHRSRTAAFEITGFHDPGLPVAPPIGTPTFRNIVCSDFVVSDAPKLGAIHGLPERWVESVVLKDLLVHEARSGLVCENVKGLSIENLTIAPDAGPAVALKNVSDVEIRRLRVGKTNSNAAIVLDGAHDVLVASCKAPPDLKVFLALEGAGSDGIVLVDNVVPSAALQPARGIVVKR